MRVMRRYCVIGYPVGHSFSPMFFNRAFRRLKIPARCEAIEVRPRELAGFMRVFRERFVGANVTIPHKEKIIKFLDELSPEAREIGAVNVIVNREGKLIGYNTDVYGAMEALLSGGLRDLSAKKALVLGAGGAGRAVVYGLKKAGAEVFVFNRTISRAKKLCRQLGCGVVRAGPSTLLPSAKLVLSVAEGLGAGRAGAAKQFLQKFHIIINATSVGMRPNCEASPLPNLHKLLKAKGHFLIVMDIIYCPRMTKFLRDAKRAGCKIITGDKMFLAQAEKTLELFTGPLDRLRAGRRRIIFSKTPRR